MFIKLTTVGHYSLDDNTFETKNVYVNVKNINYLKDITGDYGNIELNTVITFDDSWIEVVESIDDIIKKINKE